MPSKNFGTLKLLVGSEWVESGTADTRDIFNPADGEPIARIPFSTKEEVGSAARAADDAFESWKEIPVSDRVQYLFRLKQVMEAHAEELATLNTLNHGKTLEESKGDVRRTIENVEAAIAVGYSLSKGSTLDQIAKGIDTQTTKDPLGVFAIVCPFNFPLMIPFWFLPYAIVLGDTVIVKPSDLTPVPMQRMAELIVNEVKLPPGVFNMVHGGAEAVEWLIRDDEVKGVTFVGSTPVAKAVYRIAGEAGKRAIANGGAKNSIVVTTEADLDAALSPIASSFFGNTGQRCLAGANLIAVGSIKDELLGKFTKTARALKVGNGLSPQTEMGPVVSKKAKERIESFLQKGVEEGARFATDGRGVLVSEYPGGYYLGATIFDGVSPDMAIAKEEIFGPVASTIHLETLDAAIETINQGTKFGNMASIFTTNGREAREFRRMVRAGNIGINIGVAAPSAYFPFGGMRESFYGVMHPQIDSVDFFTDRKITISRW
ncbi:MAG TPA: CoA-acylating methylmalonate-semialdehyde dehydrogenase [Nitrososphaerales archaeon]|nr:CoA-acylating methylmalonate-semialdehyde dehydrogenase [Nitrososphaerales archaeon]